MQDKIILGFLEIKNLTIYEIKKAMENSINHFYSSSYGSIHPAVAKLEKNGFVTSKEKFDGKRKKKIYSITESGKENFNNWLKDDIQLTRLKEDSLVKLFFFGNLDNESRKRIITNYVKKLQQSIAELEVIKNSIDLEKIPDELSETARFQVETLKFGLDNANFMNDWYKELLTRRLEDK